MKVLVVNKEDLYYTDSLKENLVAKFIAGNYTYIEIKNNTIDDNIIYNTKIVEHLGNHMVFITEPLVLG